MPFSNRVQTCHCFAFAFLPLGIKAMRRPITSYYGGGDAIIPMRIDYVVGTAIAVSFDNSSVVAAGAMGGIARGPGGAAKAHSPLHACGFC
jgi:hypothetical protein